MIKNILIKSAELANRDDIVSALKEHSAINEINNNSIQSDVCRLLSYYNFVISNLFENYFNLSTSQVILSNNLGEISYDEFIYLPININKISCANKQFTYEINTSKISTSLSNELFDIEYNYRPKDALELTDDIILPPFLNNKIVCYGIVSEFLASKDQFDKSEYWKNKFLFEIFKIKVKKERRLKPTFHI